jgi:NAD(P)-dependent dehydrogenase (short-subunit alcohol dehydrogenase family)
MTDQRLAGRVALVTGSSRGIGRAIVVAVSGPDERPSVVQHGGVRQPGKSGGAPGQEKERVLGHAHEPLFAW